MRHAIETAPRDGTVVILEHEPTGTSDVAYWSDQAAQWVAEIGTPTDIKPTHWRSMPRENYLPLAFDQAGEPARPRRWSLGARVLAESAMTAGTSRPAQMVDAAAAAPPAAADARDNPETTKLISAGPYAAGSGKYRRGADGAAACRRIRQRTGRLHPRGDLRPRHSRDMGNVRNARRCDEGAGALCEGPRRRNFGCEGSIGQIGSVSD